ncbi:MAG: hypothetical protein COA51_07120 [Idiomarina sp.]|nr:MAG: hypothetical protein COA51_07120 [Idiomarina sp.]
MKLMIIVSLLLAPFAGQAGEVMSVPSEQSMSHHAQSHDMADMHANHDCCDTEPAQATANVHFECDNSCGDCQHHCSSSASGLIATTQVEPNMTIYEQWPNLQAVPLSRQEGQLRPPMSA